MTTIDSDVLAYVMIRRNPDTNNEATAATATSACTGLTRTGFATLLREFAERYEQPEDEPDRGGEAEDTP